MSQETIYPPPLKKGDTIGIIAPSSHYDVVGLHSAVEFLKSHGFKVIFHPQTALKYGQMAGKPEERAKAINDYFKDPDINAIFCVCGGNGAIHLLDKIDYEAIVQNPKILIGFSDITLLLNAIHAKTGLVTFHGPTLTRFKKIQPHWCNQMLEVLTGSSDHMPLHTSLSMEGILYGGNLSMMQTLIGTSYAPDMNGAILMIEDTNDHVSRYDRMIGHMTQAGWIKSLSGIMLGDFLKTQDNHDRPFGFSIEKIVAEAAPDIPTLTDLPIGHGDKLCTLPIGAKAVLKNSKLSFKSLS